ncbi:MAG: hypothetical protein LUC86_06150 [Prevotellaceae bacterium]|nr:hypothetical protein [Prevotellaceae bacterium]MCD8285363.1 hypothetical protein [Prevotellaceae bacterium]MCD8304392.1 hypothetical protein [Prevotellaceae bacterium]
MSIFSNLFKRKQKEQMRVGGIEDFMTLIRVYFQAVLANQLGITNLAALPDLRVFKQSLKVQTVNNRLGLGERKRCQLMLKEMYGISDGFFKEIDASLKKHCRNIREMQPYLLVFQDFSQNLMMSLGQLMQWKLRLPSFFHKALLNMTTKTVHEVLTSNNWKDDAMRKCVVAVRKGQQRLGYTEEWMVEYGHTILMLAKKEPRNKIDEEK